MEGNGMCPGKGWSRLSRHRGRMRGVRRRQQTLACSLGDAERGAFCVRGARIGEGGSAERADVSDEILLGAPHPSRRGGMLPSPSEDALAAVGFL